MRIILLSTVLLIGFGTIHAQNRDYKKYRDSTNNLSCRPADSLTVIQTIDRLERLDTTQFDKNKQFYYRDLGWGYYRLYMKTHDKALLQKAADAYIHRIDESKNYWNLSFCLFELDDCKGGSYYLEKYKQTAGKQELEQQHEQIVLLTAKCRQL